VMMQVQPVATAAQNTAQIANLDRLTARTGIAGDG
jgi:hypothetical protein